MLNTVKTSAATILGAWQLLAGTAMAFDCSKAALPVDFVICSGWQVEQVNQVHERAWYATRARLNNSQKKELLDDQKQWLKIYPPRCGVPPKGERPKIITSEMQDCVAAALIERSDFLNSYPHSSTPENAKGRQPGVAFGSKVITQSVGSGCKGSVEDDEIPVPDNCAHLRLIYPEVRTGSARLKESVEMWAASRAVSPLARLSRESVGIASLDELAKTFFSDYRQAQKESGAQSLTGQFVHAAYRALRNDTDFLTLEITTYHYFGGPHPVSNAYVATFDVKSGNRLKPKDLVHDVSGLGHLVKAKLVEDHWPLGSEYPFFLTDNIAAVSEGLRFVYNVYEIGPYVEGPADLVLTYSELEKILKPELKKRVGRH